MNLKTKALTLKAVDYKENDKLITLFTLQFGKIVVNARGIKKPTAKLRFCSQPFCFGDFELAKTHDFYTLTSCEQVDCFYPLRHDVEKYMCGCVLLDALNTVENEENPNPKLFLSILKTLNAIVETTEDSLKILLHFLLNYLDNLGLKPDFSHCSACKTKNPKHIYLDTQFGGTVCSDCLTQNSVEIFKSTVSALGLIDGIALDKLKNQNIPLSQQKDCLKILHYCIEQHFSPLKSVTELLKMLNKPQI